MCRDVTGSEIGLQIRFGVIATDSRREFLLLLLCEIMENESSCNAITPRKCVTKLAASFEE